MAGLVLDAGPLISIERDAALLRAWLAEAHSRATPPVVSAATVAEVWRGGRRSARLGQLFKVVSIVAVDQDLGRQAGELLAACGQTDTLDALVVVLAAQRGYDVLTGDPDDIGPLADRAGVQLLEF
ncbi:MAG: PIN domain-containing protein [Actinobacteria bacterium]|nr:PIN domain-containing protein [Actinomycetota bacterium]